MRLVTWNVNSLRARLPRVRELLAAHTPDVVCLQETKLLAEAFPRDDLAELGYQVVDHSTGRWNGVALLVADHVEVRDVQRGLPGEPDPTEGRWLEATVIPAAGANEVRVVSTYVPNGREPDHPMYAAKLAFFARMRERAAELVALGPTVVAGDVNVAPEDRDVWDPAAFVGATHVTPAERDALAAVVATGLADTYRVVAPDAVGFTWWDYRMGAFRRGMGMRIDLVLAGPDVEVLRCEVDTEFRRVNAAGDKPSDHAPVVADLNW